MDLLSMVLGAGNGNAVSNLASQNNISRDQVTDVLSKMLPELSGRLQGNVQQENGLESLLSALSKGDHQRYIEDPDLIADSATQLEGNKILGHLLGNKETSRQVASDLEGSTGISAGIIQKLLPMAATMLMGAMSKGAQSDDLVGKLSGLLGGGNQGDLLGSLLGSLSQGKDSNLGRSTAADLVGGLLKGFLK
jgi:hypothetical protein